MATISKSLSARKRGDGTSEVYFRFSAGRGEVFRVRTGIFAPVDKWNCETQGLAVPRLDTPEKRRLVEIKRRIEALERRLFDRCSEMVAGGGAITKSWLEEQVRLFHNPDWRAGGIGLGVRDLFAEYIRQQETKGRVVKVHRALQNLLALYENTGGPCLRVDTWTQNDLGRLDAWLHVGRSQNTVLSYMRVLRAFSIWSAKSGLTANRPFDGYSVPEPVFGTPYYLTFEERDLLYRLEIKSRRIAEQRDIFVFQCFVGCRVSDLVTLTKSSVVDGAVEYIPEKTSHISSKVVRVPLTRTAKEIVERYSGLSGDRLFPFRSRSVYNFAIKKFFTLAGLTRPVTVLDPKTRKEVQRPLNEIASSHLARRTFIGNLYRQVKDPNLIGALSGHVEGSRAFSRYRTIDEEIKAQVVDLLEK